jgi:hypothetical protein
VTIDLLDLVVKYGLSGLLTVAFVFGFAPGFVLRLIVLFYPADDPRREELIAELYAIPRMLRPVWVFQQIETALFEGPRERLNRRRNVSGVHLAYRLVKNTIRITLDEPHGEAVRFADGSRGITISGLGPVDEKYITSSVLMKMKATGKNRFVMDSEGKWRPMQAGENWR